MGFKQIGTDKWIIPRVSTFYWTTFYLSSWRIIIDDIENELMTFTYLCSICNYLLF